MTSVSFQFWSYRAPGLNGHVSYLQIFDFDAS